MRMRDCVSTVLRFRHQRRTHCPKFGRNLRLKPKGLDGQCELIAKTQLSCGIARSKVVPPDIKGIADFFCIFCMASANSTATRNGRTLKYRYRSRCRYHRNRLTIVPSVIATNRLIGDADKCCCHISSLPPPLSISPNLHNARIDSRIGSLAVGIVVSCALTSLLVQPGCLMLLGFTSSSTLLLYDTQGGRCFLFSEGIQGRVRSVRQFGLGMIILKSSLWMSHMLSACTII